MNPEAENEVVVDEENKVDRGDEKTEKADKDAGTQEDLENGDEASKGEDEGDGKLAAEDGDAEDEPESREARDKRIRIPKARFDAANRKAREREDTLNQRIQELESQLGEKTQDQDTRQLMKIVEDLEDKYEELILDGRKEEARKVRKDLNAARESINDRRVAARSDQARVQAIDQLKYDSLLAKYEGLHPELNPDQEDFNEDRTNEVGLLLEAFIARGFTRHAALEKAVKYVMGEPKGSTEEAAVLRHRRGEDARRKSADADKKQPSSAARVGLDSDKAGTPGKGAIDVMRLNQSQFAKLDDETKSRLRGDVL